MIRKVGLLVSSILLLPTAKIWASEQHLRAAKLKSEYCPLSGKSHVCLHVLDLEIKLRGQQMRPLFEPLL
jgi:hypothetical protein